MARAAAAGWPNSRLGRLRQRQGGLCPSWKRLGHGEEEASLRSFRHVVDSTDPAVRSRDAGGYGEA